MSIFSIIQYQKEVEKIIHFSGTKKETAIRNAFYNLLNEYAKQKGLMLVPEVTIRAKNGRNIIPDGTLKDSLRQDWGYWESKDESDNLNEEIERKLSKGYPDENILFEDSKTFILIQNGKEVYRVNIGETDNLHELITSFINFERPEVRDFRKAIEFFKQDIPKVTQTIRNIILKSQVENKNFIKESDNFLKLCQDSINPDVNIEDIIEMIIQHILTEDIFNTIFDENQFHRENNIARELEKVINTFFTGATKKIVLGTIQHYYQAINAAGASIVDHHEKQKFLKIVYETFYKSYNPKAADRLGVVYTPNEVVRFMIESTDYLLNKHFNKLLEDKNVEILDPATGTGTYICDLIDYIRAEKIEHKYLNEIHANEVAILPYYISNLNIEYTYKQRTGEYAEFSNLCFVDTLDNMGFQYRGKQTDLFAPFTEENSKRIKLQNDKRIAVIIGNPPYNANQSNENDNNKNREYKAIDKRIKDTFIKNSTAQKTKVYDMYSRFYRWAFDRINDNGIISFITNRSFLDSRTFDGFRKTIQEEFDFAYIIDTKSDVRNNPKISGTSHNIFGIQTGVAIMFLIKNNKKKTNDCEIKYICMEDEWKKEIKLQWLTENKINEIPFEIIRPDNKHNWLNISENDYDSLLALCSKNVKSGDSNKAIFKEFTIGTNTARDEWVYDFDKNNLKNKINYLIDTYNNKIRNNGSYENDKSIKWTRGLKQKFDKKTELIFDENKIEKAIYRPFVDKYIYNSLDLIEMPSLLPKLTLNDNVFIAFSGTSHSKPFQCLAVNKSFSFDLLEKTTAVPYYSFDKSGNKVENITDWGYNQFVKKYGKKNINKQSIFHYVYGVLHDPNYRDKYRINLQRDLPKIPLYENFSKWADIGKKLLELHLNYDSLNTINLDEVEIESEDTINEQSKHKIKLNKQDGIIQIGNLTIKSIPIDAWKYTLGNRSLIEWVIDQYNKNKIKDEVVNERFNTYFLHNFKEEVFELIKKTILISTKTTRIINEMPKIEPE